jgi:hypothetical protein
MKTWAFSCVALAMVVACSGSGREDAAVESGEAAIDQTTADDFILPVPFEVPPSSAAMESNQTRDMLLFMVRYFTPADTRLAFETDGRGRAVVRVPFAAVPTDVHPFFAEAARADTHGAAVTALRKALLASCGDAGCYEKYRAARHATCVLPRTVAELRMSTDDYRTSWTRSVVAPSQVKGKARAFYRAPENVPRTDGCRFVIAETLTTIDDSTDATVRETEVIQARDDGSGDYDFFAFDAAGAMVTTSTFANASGHSVEGPVPFTCMGCHYDRTQRTFQTRPLSFHP